MNKKAVNYAMILIALMCITASASIIHVPGIDSLTIQAAVDSSINGDTVLVAPGTYFENVIISGKNIVVASLFLTTGDSIYITTTVIDGSSITRPISIIGGVDTTMVLTGFTVQNGYGYGGGIVCNQSSPIITHNIVQNNRSTSYGGGIFCSQSSPIIESNTIISNSIEPGGANSGGGICCFWNSHPSIVNNVIEANIATRGGGINCAISSNPMITGNMIAYNQADSGAGIYCITSSPIIENNVIIGDSANVYGGGMYFNQSDPVIQGNTIKNNFAYVYGGGIYGIGNSIIELRNNSFYDNGVWLYGGAIYCDHCSLTVINNTLHSNFASWGSGIALFYTSSTIHNSIFAGHLNGIAIGVGSPTGIEISYCNFFENVMGDYEGFLPPGIGVLTTTNYNGDSCDTYANIYLDPQFVDPVNYDLHLTAGSPCIDAGDPLTPLDPDSTVTDMGRYYFDQSPPGIPNSITDLTISCDSLNAHLIWSPVTTDTSGNPITISRYVVYASDDPLFVPTPSDSIGFATPPDSSYTDIDALAEPRVFYNVRTRVDN